MGAVKGLQLMRQQVINIAVLLCRQTPPLAGWLSPSDFNQAGGNVNLLL